MPVGNRDKYLKLKITNVQGKRLRLPFQKKEKKKRTILNSIKKEDKVL